MGRPATAALYVIAMAAVVVGVDVLVFRGHFWSGWRPTSASSWCSERSTSGSCSTHSAASAACSCGTSTTIWWTLGGRRVPAHEDAEVDAYLDTGLVVLPHEQRDCRLVDQRAHAQLVIRPGELLTR